MSTSLWMTSQQVANESGRHIRTVNDALRRGLLVGVQPTPRARWRVLRDDFNRWVKAGCPWQRTEWRAS